MMTADPIHDAEEAANDPRPIVAMCKYCKCEIHAGTDSHYGDDVYFNDGIWFCENCATEYLKQFKVNW